MFFQSLMASIVLLLLTVTSVSNAQGTFAYYTDNSTGIKFWQNSIPDGESTTGGFQFGIALPPNGTGSDTEYIGRIQGALHNGTLRQGWSAISHGGEMTDSLLLLAWPDPSGNNSIKTSFRYATDYVAPSSYTGNATVTPISQTVTDTAFTLIYRCQNCFTWTVNGTTASQIPGQQSEVEMLGWAQAFAAPADPSSTTSSIKFHDNGYDEFGVVVAKAKNPSYAQWAALASGSSGSASSTASIASTAVADAATSTSAFGLPSGLGGLLPTSGLGSLEPSGISLPGSFPTGGFGGGFPFSGFPSGFETIPRPTGTGSPFESIFGHHRHNQPNGAGLSPADARIATGTGAPFPFASGTGAHHHHHHHHHHHGTGLPDPTGGVRPFPMGTGRYNKIFARQTGGAFPPFPFPTGSGIAPPPVGGPFPIGAIPTEFVKRDGV